MYTCSQACRTLVKVLISVYIVDRTISAYLSYQSLMLQLVTHDLYTEVNQRTPAVEDSLNVLILQHTLPTS